MRLTPLLLLLLMIAGIARAAAPLTVQSLPYQGKGQFDRALDAGAISMPWVSSGASPAARQINDYLFLALFALAAPKQPGKLLSARDGIVIGSGVTTQKFSIVRNDEQLLTIEFRIESCGNACNTEIIAYSFDSQTGRALSSDDLFTQAGKAALALQLNANLGDSYRKELADLDKKLKQAKLAAADLQVRQVMEIKIVLNRSCLDRLPQIPPPADSAAAAARFDDNSNNTLGKTGVSMRAPSCFSYSDAANYGEKEVELTVPYQQLAPELTTYGQALLLGQGAATAPDNVYGHLLQGHLGDKSAITMLLHKYRDDSVNGFYYYEKYRRPLALSGNLKDGVLSLEESAGDGAIFRPTLTLRAQGGRLVGTWNGKSELPVDVGP